MCPRCIVDIVICCWGEGMVPMLSGSVPIEPERITPFRATHSGSTRPTGLNCCWRIVDLQVSNRQTINSEPQSSYTATVDAWDDVCCVSSKTTNTCFFLIKEANWKGHIGFVRILHNCEGGPQIQIKQRLKKKFHFQDTNVCFTLQHIGHFTVWHVFAVFQSFVSGAGTGFKKGKYNRELKV